MRDHFEMHSQSPVFDLASPKELSTAGLLETLRRSELEIEAEKSSVARTLHDEVGGLLVAALMDISWIAQQSGLSEVVQGKLTRALGLLRGAIDIKRKLVETLRPSLLDDVGLCSTIGWHLKASCDAAGVGYSESYPFKEPYFSADFKIGAFRVFQKALTQILSDRAPSELSLEVEIIDNTLHCLIASHLLESGVTGSEMSLGNTPLHHRVRQMGGACQWLQTPEGNRLNVTIPVPSCIRPDAATRNREALLQGVAALGADKEFKGG
jgi:signal transduction histidine kinase